MNNNMRLSERGIIEKLSIDNVICDTYVERAGRGPDRMNIKIHTKENWTGTFYKGYISIPPLSYPTFREALEENGIEVRVDPNNPSNYYMCLEKVAASKWIPNSCKIVPERKIKVLFWLVVNVIVILAV